jgi:hypothetical protein
MSGELRIERQYLPDPKRETQALLLLLGLRDSGVHVVRAARPRSDCLDVSKDNHPGEGCR